MLKEVKIPKIKGERIVMLIIIIFTAYLLSCNTTEPPPGEKPTLALKLEVASCTEAWVKLSIDNSQLPIAVILKQTSQGEKDKESTLNLSTADTLLYIDSLLPNTSYQYQVSSIVNPANSNKLTVTTLDTTSHDFTFTTYTFGGQAGSCTLYDVAIIDENDIWAVGEIYLLDSLGQPDPRAYNAVHWDGNEWELKRIKTNACGGVDYPPIKTIFAFSSNDILFAHIDGSISHYNGTEFTNDCSLIAQLNGSANKIWGISRTDFYVVSGKGFIAHYQNGLWSKIESSTDIRLTDIYGTADGQNLWVCGWDNNHSGPIILSIDNSIATVIWDGMSVNGEYWNLINTLWTNGGEFWLAGGFVFRQSVLFQDKGHLVRTPTETGSKLFDPGNFVLNIRGTGKNNIFLAGDLGMLWHFNGISWHKYDEIYSEQLDRRLYSVSVKNNLVVAVGWKESNAWIVLGHK